MPRPSHLLHALLPTLSLTSLATAQSTNSTIDFTSCCSNAQDATSFALAYGVPLVAYANFTSTLLAGIGGPNRIIAAPGLSNPSEKNVVKPNVDTVYTIAFVDLSGSDLVFTVPEINDGRYWVYPFYDPYGNQFAELSSVNGAPAGQYLVRRADDAGAMPGTQLTPASSSCISMYKGIINFPTTHGTLLSRILVRENTTSDLDAVKSYQKGTGVTAVARSLTNANLPQAPMLTPDLLDTSSISDPNEKALTLLARMGAYNQPPVLSDRYRVASILGLAGITNDSYVKPAGVDLEAAYATALAATTAEIRNPSNLNIQTNGWVLQNLATQGNFGTDFGSRFYIALNGYLQLVPSEAQYPTYAPAQISPTVLGAKQAYLFTFFGKPPTLPLPGTSGKQGGFWSLTAYGPDQFLISNAEGVYEVGDRSGITYSDGTRVYPSANATAARGLDGRALNLVERQTTGGSNATADSRQFQVLLQPADVKPPSNWTSNWLPGPKSGGEVLFLCKLSPDSAA